MLNSRPLCAISKDSKDDNALTPNHFLSGQYSTESLKSSGEVEQFRERWRRIQEVSAHFWKRWREEIIPTWRARKKWREEKQDVKVGDLVWLLEKGTGRNNWPMGRIVEVINGKDGKVRVIKVMKCGMLFTRNITGICPLEIVDSGMNQSGGYVPVPIVGAILFPPEIPGSLS